MTSVWTLFSKRSRSSERQVLLAGQPEVIGDEHAVCRQAPQLVAIGVAERIRIEQPVGDSPAAATLGGHLAEVLEQKPVAAADGRRVAYRTPHAWQTA